jgi:hypothetical protein
MPRVLVAVPGEEVTIQTIAEGSTALREKIGGTAQCVQLGGGFVLYCNHDGNAEDLAVNPHFSQGIIKGPFVITKAEGEGRNIGVNEEDFRYIMQNFIRC